MADLIEINEIEEKVVLVGVSVSDHDDTEESLEELKDLVKTAGATTIAMVIQNREKVHPGTYIGKGKIEEVREIVEREQATGIVCDDELSPAQLRNLEDALGTKVMDRTMVILDIFAQRANTREGKIQVELAQLRYRATRLVGLRNSLSRLGGSASGAGIGSKGPGEKKLELDRRLIKDRISQLKSELADIVTNREVLRNLRSKNAVPVVAIVGYTNAGKSTLLNHLTDANVLEEDKLFATLDPTTRNLKLESGQEILLTDTVGFIRKLPHHLIDAFRSTLEEAKYADIILHVVDSSNEMADKQMHIVYQTLADLGVKDKTIITAFNKQDRLEGEQLEKDYKADYTVKISAKTGDHVDELLHIIQKILQERKVLIEKVFSYEDAGRIQQIRKYGQLLEEDYRQEGIYVKAYMPKEMYQAFLK